MKRIVFLLFSFALLFNVTTASAAREGTVFRRVDCEEKLIALTFDDGPHPEKTEKVLEVLDHYDVKATFFVVGQNAERYPEIVQRCAEKGHEIGNHTYTHRYFNRLSAIEAENEIKKDSKLLEALTGAPCRLFRPPGGIFDSASAALASKAGMKTVIWNVDTKDWAGESADNIFKNVTKNACNGSIILFHDYTGNKSHTLEALRLVIPYLLNEGYSLVTVSELISRSNAAG